MNPLVIPVTSVKFKSCDEQWIVYKKFSVFGQIENLWMDKIASRHLHQFRETKLVEIS